MKIKIKKLKENAKLPTYALPGDVGMDMYSMETVTIQPMEQHRFWHGFALEFPEGYGGIVMDKGSISKAGLTHLINLSDKPYTFELGDKVAQLVIMPIAIVELEETDTLSESVRGEGMFGSTGKK